MTDTPHSDAHDAIVVGAGPVGMTAALLLGSRGVSTLLLERQTAPSASPKAISLDDSSMRTYQRAGIDDMIAPIIVPGTGTAYFGVDGRLLFHARGPGGAPQGHPFKNPFAQPDLEAVLDACIQANGAIELRRGAEVTDVAPTEAGPIVEYRLAGTTHQAAAQFVIAADGGRSTIRQRLGISMAGQSFNEPWLVVDTLDDHHDERFGMHHGDPERPTVIVPGLHGRCRYEFKLHPDEGSAGTEPTLDLIQRLLKPFRTIDRHHVERATIYRFHALVAEAFQSGAVFLVGDAAHMMPPFAGQGLNSGIRDVANLTWKIADVTSGRLPRAALATYEIERRPHVEQTVEQSVLLGANVMTSSREVAVERDRRVREALESDNWRTYLERMDYRPSIALENGLISPTLFESPVGSLLEQPTGFCMTEHRTRRLDELLGIGWSVVGVDVDDIAWTRVERLVKPLEPQLVAVITTDRNPRTELPVMSIVDYDGTVAESFRPHRGMFLLVRPDRFVAAAWEPDAPHATPAIQMIQDGLSSHTDSPHPRNHPTERCPLWVRQD